MDTIAIREKGEKAANRILFRQTRVNRFFARLLGCVSGSVTDRFLLLLLKAMSLVFRLDPHFRKHIKDFEAEYVFADQKSRIYVVARFRKNKLKVRKRPSLHPTFTLIFKDGGTLMKLLFSKSPDILGVVLRQEVDFKGSINYLSKFVYMAMSLRKMAIGW